MVTYVGIDIGTSAVKAVLVDEAQRILATGTRSLMSSQPRPGWWEQAPDDWWRAANAVAADLAAAAPDSWRGVKAIGISGQMHGLVSIDAAGRVIRPAILWNDGRAIEEAAVLAAIPDVAQLVGVLPMAGLTAPKAMWLRSHEPQHFDRIACIMLPKDYLRQRLSEAGLTGDLVTDVSDAAGTVWLDQAQRNWSQTMLTACGLNSGQVPKIVEGPTPVARMHAGIARAWNLPDAPLLVAGGGDATLGAVGIGAVDDGDAFVSIGTSAQYFITRDRYVPSGADGMIHGFAQALPRRWSQTAALLNGASCLTWFAGLLGRSSGNGAAMEELLDDVEAQYAGPRPELFLPYLAGERTPHNDPQARGMFTGLSHASGRPQLLQSVLEGIGHALVDAQDCLRAAGAEVERLAVVGGGVRSRLWVRILASMLGKPLTLHDGAERGPAFGAARLARLGFTGETIADVCTRPAVLDVVEPDRRLAEQYAVRQGAFRRLYRATRGMWVGT